MADMGLAGMMGAGGVADAMSTLFNQRMEQARLAQQADQFNRSQAQQEALTRARIDEVAAAARNTAQNQANVEADRREMARQHDETQAYAEANTLGPNQDVSGDVVQGLVKRAPTLISRFEPKPITVPAPPPSILAPGESNAPTEIPTAATNAPLTAPDDPSQHTYRTIPTKQDLQFAETDKRARDLAESGNEWRYAMAELRAQINAMNKNPQRDRYVLKNDWDPTGTRVIGASIVDMDNGTTRPVQGHTFAPAPNAAALLNKDFSARTGMSTADRLDEDFTEAAKMGLLGPESGRFFEGLEKYGDSYNSKMNYLMGKIQTDTLMMKLHTDAGFGGARGAANSALLEQWKDIAGQKNARSILAGYIDSLRASMKLELLPGANVGNRKTDGSPAANPAATNKQEIVDYGPDGKVKK